MTAESSKLLSYLFKAKNDPESPKTTLANNKLEVQCNIEQEVHYNFK